jgi:hypothetical protein
MALRTHSLLIEEEHIHLFNFSNPVKNNRLAVHPKDLFDSLRLGVSDRNKYAYPLSIFVVVNAADMASYRELGDGAPSTCSASSISSSPSSSSSSSSSSSLLYAAFVNTLTDLFLLSHCSTIVGLRVEDNAQEAALGPSSRGPSLLDLAALIANATRTLHHIVYL